MPDAGLCKRLLILVCISKIEMQPRRPCHGTQWILKSYIDRASRDVFALISQ